jgi:phospholipase C
LELTAASYGGAGVVLSLYRAGGGEPRFYTLGKEGYLTDEIRLDPGPYAFTIHGPNGFLRGFGGEIGGRLRPEANGWFLPEDGRLRIALHNEGSASLTFVVTPQAYLTAAPRRHRVRPGEAVMDDWDLGRSHNWYDLMVTCAEVPNFRRRLAGHCEDGTPSVSDPLLGRQA